MLSAYPPDTAHTSPRIPKGSGGGLKEALRPTVPQAGKRADRRAIQIESAKNPLPCLDGKHRSVVYGGPWADAGAFDEFRGRVKQGLVVQKMS